jgi:two-component system, cell cycle response regulator DivK
MIVDDKDETRELTRELIGAFADEVCECIDGNVAAVQCALFCPDVVMMDLDMPLTDNLEATRRILVKHPAARVTVLKQPFTASSGNHGGACHFFAKDNLPALLRHLEQRTR